MRLAVVTLGSAGDLHPYLAIAREMDSRGHEVHFFSQAPHRTAVEAEGLRFAAIASERDHDRTLRHPALWHPVRGFGVLWRHLCVPAIQPTFDAIAALDDADAQPLTVLASPLAVGARLVREIRPAVRLLTAYTAPSALRSCSDPMFLGPWRVPYWVPRPLRSALWQTLDAWKLEPMARTALTRGRTALSLDPHVGSTFGAWIHSPDGGVCLFPRWFAQPQADWPLQPAFAGFPVYEPGAKLAPMDALLQRFLAQGPPPVVVIAGSAAYAGRDFLLQGWGACSANGKRCVLLRPYADEWPEREDHNLLTLPAAQLSGLLPHAAAVIHHGGIGTCAQAWAAHTPQLILPTAYDQFDNGERVARAGWGLSVRRTAGSSASGKRRLAQALATVLRTEPASEMATSTLGEAWPTPSFRSQPNAAVLNACQILEDQKRTPPI